MGKVLHGPYERINTDENGIISTIYCIYHGRYHGKLHGEYRREFSNYIHISQYVNGHKYGVQITYFRKPILPLSYEKASCLKPKKYVERRKNPIKYSIYRKN